MAYSTAADVRDEFPDVLLLHLTDDAATGAIIDAIITQAIAWGEDFYINPLCADRYDVSKFTSAIVQIKRWSINLAWHRLHQRYSDSKKTQKTFDEIVGTEDEPGQLRLVQAGKLRVYGADAYLLTRDYYVTYEVPELPDIGLDDLLDETWTENEED